LADRNFSSLERLKCSKFRKPNLEFSNFSFSIPGRSRLEISIEISILGFAAFGKPNLEFPNLLFSIFGKPNLEHPNHVLFKQKLKS